LEPVGPVNQEIAFCHAPSRIPGVPWTQSNRTTRSPENPDLFFLAKVFGGLLEVAVAPAKMAMA